MQAQQPQQQQLPQSSQRQRQRQRSINATREGLYIFGSNIKYRCGLFALHHPGGGETITPTTASTVATAAVQPQQPQNNENVAPTTTTTTTTATTTSQNALQTFDNIYYLSPKTFFNNERIIFASAAYKYTLVMTHMHRLLIAGETHMFFENESSSSPISPPPSLQTSNNNTNNNHYHIFDKIFDTNHFQNSDDYCCDSDDDNEPFYRMIAQEQEQEMRLQEQLTYQQQQQTSQPSQPSSSSSSTTTSLTTTTTSSIFDDEDDEHMEDDEEEDEEEYDDDDEFDDDEDEEYDDDDDDEDNDDDDEEYGDDEDEDMENGAESNTMTNHATSSNSNNNNNNNINMNSNIMMTNHRTTLTNRSNVDGSGDHSTTTTTTTSTSTPTTDKTPCVKHASRTHHNHSNSHNHSTTNHSTTSHKRGKHDNETNSAHNVGGHSTSISTLVLQQVKKQYRIRSSFRVLHSPVTMEPLSIRHILTLQKCVICIDDQLTFWTIGANSHGEMGVGDHVKSLYRFTALKPLESEHFLRKLQLFTGSYGFSGASNMIKSGSRYGGYPHDFTFSSLSHVSHGAYHVVLVFGGQYIYTVGFNGCGELGIGSTTSQSTYHRVSIDLPSKVRQLSIGLNHNIFLLEDGSIYVNGYNAFGQLGLGHYEKRLSLTRVTDPLVVNNRVCSVTTGYHHTVYVTEDYRVFACGWNKDYAILLQRSGHTFCQLVEITSCINQVCRSPFEVNCGGYTIFVSNRTDVYAAGRLDERNSFEPQGSFVHVMSGCGLDCVPDSGFSHGLILCQVTSSDAGILQTFSNLRQRCFDGKLADITIVTQQ